MTLIKVACYCRVSTDSKDQANSFENQQTYFLNVLEHSKDCKLINIYADQGLTGTKLSNRPEFNKMLKDAGIDIIEQFTSKDRRLKKKHILYEITERPPLFNEIWIKNTSRFARNTLSFEIINLLRNKGVHIKFIEQNINTKDISSDFLLKLFQLFDEQESRDKSSKVSFGIREGARKGTINANSRLYGYNYIRAENRLEIIPSEASVIKTIYKLYSQGQGIRRIINYLNDNTIMTREKKPFCKSTIKRILTNEKYAGINARLKYDTGKVFNKYSYPQVKPKDQWIIQESDKIPSIISKELFYSVQTMLQSKVNHKNQVGIYKGITDYAGIILCGKCGNPYISNMDRGRRFYNCKTKKLKGTGACNNKNISENKLNTYITSENYRRALYKYKVMYKSVLEDMVLQLQQRINTDSNLQAQQLGQELNKYKAQQSKLLNSYLESIIDESIFKQAAAELKDKITETEYKIKELTKPNNEIMNDIAYIQNTINDIDSLEIKEQYTRDEIIAGIEKIIINDDKVKVYYKVAANIRQLVKKHDLENYFNKLLGE